MSKRIALPLIRYIFSLIILLALGFAVFLYWAVGKSLPYRSKLPIERQTTEQPVHFKNPLVVASYNIGHGQGVKEHPWDYRNKKVTLSQLSMIAEAIKKLNADIILAQEVDLDSNRTFHINQIEFLKERTNFPYHACAVVWDKNYIPFPYWPISHHIGFVKSANCVLSKYPLSNQERLIFKKPESNPFWYNWGYIDRGIQRVDVKLGNKKIALLNVHLEAWEVRAREKQIKVINDYIKEINIPVILGGDFNTVPLGTKKLFGFADDAEADYSKENTFLWFKENAVDLKIPQIQAKGEDPFELFTFPSDAPNRRLDHIFLLGKSLSFIDFRVGKEAGLASDHLPVVGMIKVQ